MTDEPNNPADVPRDVSDDRMREDVVAQVAPVETADEAAGNETSEAQEVSAPKPEASQPETSQPETSQPETSQPEASQPETSQPETSQPETSQPGPAQDEAAEGDPQDEKSEGMDWYILKVQSNREDSIREGLLRRVAIAGLEQFFGDVIVPTEKVTEFKGGKKRVMKRKLYPGYLVVQMEINDDTWFLVRETPGIGDFTGAVGKPTPMLPHEVSRILVKQEEKSEKQPKLRIGFHVGDHVKITEGNFESFEGEVESIDESNGQITVIINIFNRSTPVTLEYWQIESV